MFEVSRFASSGALLSESKFFTSLADAREFVKEEWPWTEEYRLPKDEGWPPNLMDCFSCNHVIVQIKHVLVEKPKLNVDVYNALVAVPIHALTTRFSGESQTSDLDDLIVHDDIDKTLALQSQQVIWNPGDDPLILLMAALRELSIAQERRHLEAAENQSIAQELVNG